MKTDTLEYRFGIPLDEVFIAATNLELPVVNGIKLSRDEQKLMAVCLWTWMKQNAPGNSGGVVQRAIEQRWPDCSWAAA